MNIVDIASGYKVSRPLKTKKAKEVADMFQDIYKKGPLKYPEHLHVDSGTEFKAEVLKLMKEHNVPVKSVITRYHHSFTSLVENFNKTLAQNLFKIQDAQELNDSSKDSKTWVKYLYKTVSRLNNTKLQRIGITPAKAIKLEEVTLKFKDKKDINIYLEDGLFRYLLEPGEENNDQKRRATDNIWSRKAYRLDRIVENPGQRVLAEGPERAFVCEELMLIHEDTEVPPDYVKKW